MITARRYASAVLCHHRVFVYLLHSGIVSKRLNVGRRTPLTEINDTVDDEPVFVTPWMVDASAAIH